MASLPINEILVALANAMRLPTDSGYSSFTFDGGTPDEQRQCVTALRAVADAWEQMLDQDEVALRSLYGQLQISRLVADG